MKRLLLPLMFILLSSAAIAAPNVAIAPISDIGTPVTLAVSSTTLTQLPSSQTTGRAGFYVTNTSTRPVAGFLGNCTSTALADTIRPFYIASGTAGHEATQKFDARDDVCLWLISTETTEASQNVHYQEIKR